MSSCEWWIPVVISAVSLILSSLLLLTLYIMLSRQIASHSCGKQGSSSCAAQPQQPPPSSAAGEGLQGAASMGSSETSSESSEESGSSPSCPQGSCSGDNLHYTSLVFSEDYKKMKSRADYVNVDPKSRKVDLWPCSSPGGSKSIEYTEVKL